MMLSLRFRTGAFCASLAAVSAMSAQAATTLFAGMTNDAETTAVVPTTSGGTPRPVSFGSAVFILNDEMTALTFSAVVFNIDVTGSQTPDTNDNLTAAHIHGSPTFTPETTGPPVWGFFGAPFNETSPNDFLLVPFDGGAVGGAFSGKWDLTEGNNTTLLAQLPNLLSNRTYVNFHTTQFAGGEIRGNLSVVPEIPTTLLTLLPAAGCLLSRRRKAREALAPFRPVSSSLPREEAV